MEVMGSSNLPPWAWRLTSRRSTQANGLSYADGSVCIGPLVEQMLASSGGQVKSALTKKPCTIEGVQGFGIIH
jgi:hypothetical protein